MSWCQVWTLDISPKDLTPFSLSRLFLVVPVERHRPGLAVVARALEGLPHTVGRGAPCRAVHSDRRQRVRMRHQHHRAVAETATESGRVAFLIAGEPVHAAGIPPELMPLLGRLVVDVEAAAAAAV